MVQEEKEEFWDRWVREIVPTLFKQSKWYKYKRNMHVGDVTLRSDETAAGQSQKYTVL